MAALPKKLPPIHRSLVVFIENSWNIEGVVPNKALIAERFDTTVDEVEEWFEDELFQEVLEKKYLLRYYDDNVQAGLSADQIMVLDILCDPTDKSTILQKLRRARKTPAWLAAQYRDSTFVNVLNQRSQDTFKNRAFEVRAAIANAAASGDMKAATLYMGMTGEYEQRNHVQHSGSVGIHETRTVALLVEVLQRHIDPTLLPAIARDFEIVMSGGTLPPAYLSLPVEGVKVTRGAPEKALSSQNQRSTLSTDDALNLMQQAAKPVDPNVALILEKTKPKDKMAMKRLFEGFEGDGGKDSDGFDL